MSSSAFHTTSQRPAYVALYDQHSQPLEAPVQLSGLPRVFVHALAFSSTPSHADAAEFSSTPSHAALLLGTAWQHRTGPSWASNDAPLKDLSNTRALKHLASLATDYWAASHSFVEPGHSCFVSKFEKIVSVSEFLTARMQWGRTSTGMETVGPLSNSKCDSVKG